MINSDKKRGVLPFVGAIDSNNGISCFIDKMAIHEGNVITVNYNGSVAEKYAVHGLPSPGCDRRADGTDAALCGTGI